MKSVAHPTHLKEQCSHDGAVGAQVMPAASRGTIRRSAKPARRRPSPVTWI